MNLKKHRILNSKTTFQENKQGTKRSNHLVFEEVLDVPVSGQDIGDKLPPEQDHVNSPVFSLSIDPAKAQTSKKKKKKKNIYQSYDTYDKCRYRLSSMIVHVGDSVHSGHFVAYVRARNLLWYQIKDTEVKSVTLQTVRSQSAYMLFYVRDPPTSPTPSPLAPAIANDGPDSVSDGTMVRNNHKRSQIEETEDMGEMEVISRAQVPISASSEDEAELGDFEIGRDLQDDDSDECEPEQELDNVEENDDDNDGINNVNASSSDDDDDDDGDGDGDAFNTSQPVQESKGISRSNLNDPKRGFVTQVATPKAPSLSNKAIMHKLSKRSLDTTDLPTWETEEGEEAQVADDPRRRFLESQPRRSQGSDIQDREKSRYDHWDAILDAGKTKKVGKAARDLKRSEEMRAAAAKGINPFQTAAEQKEQKKKKPKLEGELSSQKKQSVRKAEKQKQKQRA